MDLENFPISDPVLAANHIGTMLHTFFHGDVSAGGAHTPNPGEAKVAPTSTITDPVNQVAGDPGPTPPQPDSTITQTASGGDPSIVGDQNVVDPVPQGTAVASPYGPRGGGFHGGIDLAVPLNTQLLAAQSGTVTHAANDDPSGYGEWVEITTPDGHHIRYGHLHAANVNVGDSVKAGQVIGSSGGERGGPTSGDSEGPHLHFEVRDPNGQTVDPTPWLAGGHAISSASPQEITVTKTSTQYDPQQVVHAELANTKSILTGETPTENPEGKKVTTQQKFAKNGAGSGQPGADDDPGAVDAFLAATRKHESGGNYHIYNQSGQSNASGAYQFLGSTWQSLGGSTGSAAEASPEEQDRIARNYAMQLFQQFHSWKLVAAAWYGGPGIAQRMAQGQDVGAPSGQGAYAAYAQTIGDMMARGEGA